MIREIPIIDFSDFDSDNKKLRNSVAKKIHEAASKVGFMYVKNINIKEQVIKETFNSSANFFSLPDKKKKKDPISRKNKSWISANWRTAIRLKYSPRFKGNNYNEKYTK